ncbi:hypothetical protein AKJ45_02700 [candidate division MSBL1 archaeon SCGC-AAA261F19]|uniref:Prefoldin subunit alpha n=2 Tax=candidate division MSBL1 TaxID=215777 RepID=A0A133V9B4_9EURY|nr:hypothetical protein AKJ43_01375 [candidate division MSBL1 archaeon SCGC-AAA261D19]KXB03043.1 hypothetical protein AKJ45_02700 [candidate division MSBL1 archaeon SCGC-AAA261F19]
MEDLSREERQELQRVAIELEQAQQTSEKLERRIDLLSMSKSEIERATETVQGVNKLDAETEILVPIGSDSFIKAKLTRPDKVLSGLGGDLVAELGYEEAVEMLGKRRGEVEKSIEETEKKLQKISERIEGLKPRAEQLVAKARKTERPSD